MDNPENYQPQPGQQLYRYELRIEAGTPSEAQAILEALVKLYYSLSNEDLCKLAELVENRPDLVQQAKRLL